MKNLRTVLPKMCEEMGVSYAQEFHPQKIFATHHCFNFLKKMIENDYEFDGDDNDASLKCAQDHNHVTINMVDYCIDFTQNNFAHIKESLRLADSLQITKTNNNMVMLCIDFLWEEE